MKSLTNEHAALLKAAKVVLAGLCGRIDAADRSAVPVFDGIADLSDAINASEKAGRSALSSTSSVTKGEG